ncbi:MAG: Glu/Leu/Phe/Val dehydrogenase [archaeon]
MENQEVFDSIRKRLEKVSEFMKLSKEEVDLLLKHEKVSYAVLDVNGKNYDAWRILHSNALGPGKGGIRFHPDVSEDEVKSLSFWMSLKTSLLGLPLGGGKGGVRFNPKEVNQEELEQISRAYVRAFSDVIGADKDIPAPDVYTNSQTMAWMLDEYEKIKNKNEPGMITGKPLELGGIALRTDSTSKGGFIVLKDFLEKVGEDSKDIKIAIQGFGNAGSYIGEMLENEGYKVVAVSDSKGGVYKEDGLDVVEISNLKKEGKSVVDYDAEKISNSELLELGVDILILAALENQITSENADNIKAKYILELANGPIDSEADEILFKKDIVVIPDILANAGGVVVSYFEWSQNKVGNILEEEFLKNKLTEYMKNAFNKVYKLYEENKEDLSMREAAYVFAIERILNAERVRGNLSKRESI